MVSPGGSPPRVRVVVVNYNGRDHLGDCLTALLATKWPADRLDIVVVDNASADGSAEIVRDFPGVRLIASATNVGFAGGCNLGIGQLRDVDYVALINSDAFVEPDWLEPMVDAAEGGHDIGAVSAKLVFQPRFVEVRIETDGFVPETSDSRLLGVRLSGTSGPGNLGWRWVRFPSGFFHAETSTTIESEFRWSSTIGTVFVPVTGPTRAVQVRLAAERAKTVVLTSGGESRLVHVTHEPSWHEVPAGSGTFDVVQNAGSLLVAPGAGADRGFEERDSGQYDQRAEVFAWCGGAVLLKASYLREVGRFDDSYFIYYEDFDLSWRGRARGWRYVFEPDAVVRHIHAASTIEGSRLFTHFVDRNRLLTLVKHAPRELVVANIAHAAGDAATLMFNEARRPAPDLAARFENGGPRLRMLAAFGKRLPDAIRERRRLDTVRVVPKEELAGWMITR